MVDEQMRPMADGDEADLERYLKQAAQNLPYPATPDVSESVWQALETGRERFEWPARWLAAAIVILVLAGALYALPPVRAAVRDVLRIGNIEIFPKGQEPEPHPEATVIILPESLLNLAGRTTLIEAEAAVDFPIALPTYPPEVGPPDYVFLQDIDGEFVILVWVKPEQPDEILFSLYELSGDAGGGKSGVEMMEEVRMGRREAYWIEGYHWLEMYGRGEQITLMRRRVEGNVLLWYDGDVTYRLETDLPMEEVLQIAESLE